VLIYVTIKDLIFYNPTCVQKKPHPGQHWCKRRRFLWLSHTARNGIFTAGRTNWGL